MKQVRCVRGAARNLFECVQLERFESEYPCRFSLVTSWSMIMTVSRSFMQTSRMIAGPAGISRNRFLAPSQPVATACVILCCALRSHRCCSLLARRCC